MFTHRLGLVVAAACGLVCIVPQSRAQLLFAQDFDFDSTGDWIVNSGPGNNLADFFFDYSTVGIPLAPRSSGTVRRGLKLQANLSGGIFGGISVSPFGLSLTGDYILSFDFWQNYNGPVAGGGNGTTQAGGAGIGTSGTVPQWAGSAQSSVFFATTVDGGSAADYRAYSSAASASYQDDSGVYAAGAVSGVRNNTHPYYAGFGGTSAPAEQLTLFPGQTGTSAAGVQGFAWHRVDIAKIENTVTWKIDNLLIATINLTGLTLSGGNILFTHFDTNAASSTDPLAPTLLFSLVDNVTVNQIPEPSAGLLVLLGCAGLGLRRRH
jgi:hypothetical protein